MQSCGEGFWAFHISFPCHNCYLMTFLSETTLCSLCPLPADFILLSSIAHNVHAALLHCCREMYPRCWEEFVPMQTESAQTSPRDGLPRSPTLMMPSEYVYAHPQVLRPYHLP